MCNESQLEDIKEENVNSSLPPIESTLNYELINKTIISPINSNQPEPPLESIIFPPSQPSLETTNLFNSGIDSNGTNENGCAIAIQVDEDYEEEENDDEISETVALTQKFDKIRMKKD